MSEPVLKLALLGTDEVVAHACGTCRIVRLGEDAAARCCVPLVCECGELAAKHRTACDACIAQRDAERERKLFEAAEKVSWRDYDGMLFDAAAEQFHEDTGSLEDDYESDDQPLPEYAWACKLTKLTLCAHDIVESAIDSQEHHEGAWDQVASDLPELQKALDAWCAAQSVATWEPDFKRAVLLRDDAEVSDG